MLFYITFTEKIFLVDYINSTKNSEK